MKSILKTAAFFNRMNEKMRLFSVFCVIIVLFKRKGWTDGRMKTACIMEGGAMRGLFTAGVLDVLMENGITFDGAAGLSAGACFGCNLKSGQIGRALRYNKRFCNDPRYVSFRSLLRTGDLYNVAFCYHEVPDRLDVFDRKAFRENPMAFWIGATNVERANRRIICARTAKGRTSSGCAPRPPCRWLRGLSKSTG